MLRRSSLFCDSFKEHYHRVHLPRRLALQQYQKREETRRRREQQTSSSHASKGGPRPGDVPYRYNRWWVSNDHEFVHQYAFVEDPAVTQQRRTTLPAVTKENIWKVPQQTFFLPFAPYVRVVDGAKDPDTKFLKPVNIPRWKDYMQRTKPVVPRTWY